MAPNLKGKGLYRFSDPVLDFWLPKPITVMYFGAHITLHYTDGKIAKEEQDYSVTYRSSSGLSSSPVTTYLGLLRIKKY